LAALRDIIGPATWTTNHVGVAREFNHTCRSAGSAKWLSTTLETSSPSSLAVDEQFYLVWPAVLLRLLRRRIPARWLALMMGGLAAWWVLAVITVNPNYAYLALETAELPILGGCLVALRSGTSQRNPAGSFAALLVHMRARRGR
jgi:hypothetical protein